MRARAKIDLVLASISIEAGFSKIFSNSGIPFLISAGSRVLTTKSAALLYCCDCWSTFLAWPIVSSCQIMRGTAMIKTSSASDTIIFLFREYMLKYIFATADFSKDRQRQSHRQGRHYFHNLDLCQDRSNQHRQRQ